MANRTLPGMRNFMVIWLGQLISITGSSMTTFGITIWLWQETGQATPVAIHAFLAFAPAILISPIAGVVIDRFNRKLVMLASDVGAGAGTLVILLLYSSGQLETWHLYAIAGWSGTVGAFQVPALAAAITTLVPKDRLSRANALRSLASTSAQMIAPALAGLLLSRVDITFILVADLAALGIAVITLLLVRIPDHQRASTGSETGFWSEALTGFRFLTAHRGLLGLSLAFTSLQFFGMMTVTLLAPMVLARTGGSEATYGLVAAATGAGGAAGALLMTLLPPPRRFAPQIAVGIIAGSVGFVGLGLSAGTIDWIASGAFAFLFFPVVGAASAALKQRKTPPGIQGRVFAADQLLQTSGLAAGILIAGPLADRVFEPAAAHGAGWMEQLVPLVGAGPGSGMAILIIAAGIGGIATGVATICSRAIRTLERNMPDHDEPQLSRQRPSARRNPRTEPHEHHRSRDQHEGRAE